MVVCKCKFLDGREVDITIDKNAKGEDLFESACKYAGIYQKEFFGLVYRGADGNLTFNWWLENSKKIKRQIPGKAKVWAFALVAKYYPKQLDDVIEEGARLHIVSQVRQDLLLGKTTCPTSTLALLTSYWLQSEYGDWASKEIDSQLADAFQYIQKGTENGKSDIDFRKQMMELHKTRKGMGPPEADRLFLRLAASLDHYGVHFYPAYEIKPQADAHGNRSTITPLSSPRDEKGPKVILGIGSQGIHRLKKSARELIYTWRAIKSVSFKRNKAILKLQGAVKNSNVAENSGSNQSGPLTIRSYIFDDMYRCKVFWRAAISHHAHYSFRTEHNVKMKKKMLGSVSARPTHSTSSHRRSSVPPIPLSHRQNNNDEFDLKDTPKRSSSTRRSGSPIPRPIKHKKQTSTSSTQTAGSGSHVFEPSTPRPHAIQNQETYVKRVEAESSPSIYVESPDSALVPLSSRSQRHFQYPNRPTRVANGQAVGRRGGQRLNTSQTSTSGEEVLDRLSDVTDNTDTLCSPRIIEKAFSYAEPGGINAISSWLEINPESRSSSAGLRSPSRSPSNSRSRSNDRRTSWGASKIPRLAKKNISERGRRPTRRSRIPSPPAIVISADELQSRENSYEKAVKSGNIIHRRPLKQAISYQPKKVDGLSRYTSSKSPSPALCERKNYNPLGDVYEREYCENLRQSPRDTPRSAYDLTPSEYKDLLDFERDYKSVVTSDRKTRAYDGDDLGVPTKTARFSDYDVTPRPQSSRRRDRREINSWTYGNMNLDYALSPISKYDYDNIDIDDYLLQKRSFPEIPPFVKSVR